MSGKATGPRVPWLSLQFSSGEGTAPHTASCQVTRTQRCPTLHLQTHNPL